jgi:PAS domain S-box-containing protein
VPDLESPPLERFLNAALLGAPAVILALRLRSSPSRARVTLFAGVVLLLLGLVLDVASSIQSLSDLPVVNQVSESYGSPESVAMALGLFLILVSCLQLLEHSRWEQAEILRGQEEVRLSDLRYRALFDGMREAIFATGASGEFISVNPACLELLGYDTEEEIRQVDIPTQVYVDPGDRERLLSAAEAGGFVQDFEVALRRRDGTIIRARINSSATYDEEGRLTGFKGTMQDVTVQRAAQAEISRLQELNRNIIESLSHGLFVMDRTLRTVLCNRGLERLTGTSRDRLLGRRPWEALPGLGSDDLRDRLFRALEGATVSRDRIALDGSDERPGYVSDMYSPLKSPEGEIIGVIGILEEVTDRIDLEQQLIQAEKVAAIGQMVSGIAHEINNPLTSVSGYAQLLLASDCEPAVKQDVQKIADAADRCSQVVRGLLTYSRKHEHRMTAVNAIEVLETTCDLKEYEFSVEDVVVERDYGSSLPPIQGDRYQVQQVILNLLQNAADSIVDGAGAGTIRLSAHCEGDEVVIGVFNTGEPISEDVLRRIFDPFYTTKEVGRGTGLGLSVAQNIVHNHQGAIRVRNLQDGVLFEVSFPALVAEDGRGGSVLAGVTREISSHLGKVRILVVDDEATIQELFISTFPDAEVVGVDSGHKAMVRLEVEHWDAVVTDIRMPGGISGVDLLEWVRENRPSLAPRMVLMTGAAFGDGRLEASVPKDAPLLFKPFKLDDLRARVAEAVARSAVAPAACGDQPPPDPERKTETELLIAAPRDR